MPFSTTKPLTLSSATSRAQMTTRSAKVPLPIHRLAPSSTHSSPSRRAVVSRPPATSEPPCGSVRPKAPIFSSRRMAGSHRSRCSAEPHARSCPWPARCARRRRRRTRRRRARTPARRSRRAAGAGPVAGQVEAQAHDVEFGQRRDQVVRELGPRPVVVDHRREVLRQPRAQRRQQGRLVVVEQVAVAEVVGVDVGVGAGDELIGHPGTLAARAAARNAAVRSAVGRPPAEIWECSVQRVTRTLPENLRRASGGGQLPGRRSTSATPGSV